MFVIILAPVLAEHLSFSPLVVLFPHFPVVSLCFLVVFCAVTGCNSFHNISR
jgi:hypothetical protein